MMIDHKMMCRVPSPLRVVVPGHHEAGPLQQHSAEQHGRPPPAQHCQVGRAANGQLREGLTALTTATNCSG